VSAKSYGIADFEDVATGAAILASGGGGSYLDAINLIKTLSGSWQGTVRIQDYDGTTDCCVLAMMGSPDAAVSMTLAQVQYAIANTVATLEQATATRLGCVIPVEIGAVNSIVPLIAATMNGNAINWVVDGDGAGRAVPELPQTTFGGSASLAAAPCALANDTDQPELIQSATLNAPSATTIESLAGGIVAAFGSFSGIALWPSTSANAHALSGNYIPGTLEQARALGNFLRHAPSPPRTVEVVDIIAAITGRKASAVLTNFFITAINQSTTAGSLDAGIIRLDNNPEQSLSTETHYLYNLNENLIMYSSLSCQPDIIAPDSICYYSESTGVGFSNASNDLAAYFDAGRGKSTGRFVSIIKVETLPQLYTATGVVASFAGLLRNIGYAGALPYPA